MRVKEFSTFLWIGRCKSQGSLKSFLRFHYAPEKSRAEILFFSILNPHRVCIWGQGSCSGWRLVYWWGRVSFLVQRETLVVVGSGPPGPCFLSHNGGDSDVLGEGNGTPLQYSCLENPMDGGAWWAAVHGVAKSQARQSDFTFTFHFYALEKEMATHSSVLAWRIPGTGEPGGLQSLGSHRVGCNWSDLAAAAVMF